METFLAVARIAELAARIQANDYYGHKTDVDRIVNRAAGELNSLETRCLAEYKRKGLQVIDGKLYRMVMEPYEKPQDEDGPTPAETEAEDEGYT